jgi:hypothetical protein
VLAQYLISASAAIMFALGVIHFAYTFWGPKLTPRDAGLRASMRETTLVLTRETSVWDAWIGFNASHSLGAMLFGLVYAYLAWTDGGFLFHSRFLFLVGLCLLGAYAVLGKLYWFSVPFRCIALALALYAAGLVASLMQSSPLL